MNDSPLVNYWKQVCENERISRIRNEKLLRQLNKVEEVSNSLKQKLDNLVSLKLKYEYHLNNQYPNWKNNFLLSKATQEKDQIISEEISIYDNSTKFKDHLVTIDKQPQNLSNKEINSSFSQLNKLDINADIHSYSNINEDEKILDTEVNINNRVSNKSLNSPYKVNDTLQSILISRSNKSQSQHNKNNITSVSSVDKSLENYTRFHKDQSGIQIKSDNSSAVNNFSEFTKMETEIINNSISKDLKNNVEFDNNVSLLIYDDLIGNESLSNVTKFEMNKSDTFRVDDSKILKTPVINYSNSNDSLKNLSNEILQNSVISEKKYIYSLPETDSHHNYNVLHNTENITNNDVNLSKNSNNIDIVQSSNYIQNSSYNNGVEINELNNKASDYSLNQIEHVKSDIESTDKQLNYNNGENIANSVSLMNDKPLNKFNSIDEDDDNDDEDDDDDKDDEDEIYGILPESNTMTQTTAYRQILQTGNFSSTETENLQLNLRNINVMNPKQCESPLIKETADIVARVLADSDVDQTIDITNLSSSLKKNLTNDNVEDDDDDDFYN